MKHLAFSLHYLIPTIPETADRLRIPVVNTPEKEMQQELNEDALTSFCRHNIVEVDGETISFREFYNKFGSTLTQRDKGILDDSPCGTEGALRPRKEWASLMRCIWEM
jgi:hypothetical protein